MAYTQRETKANENEEQPCTPASGGYGEEQVFQNLHARRLAPALLSHAGGARYQDINGRLLSEVYDLNEELGAGATSTVYLATDKITGEERAVKLVYVDSFGDGYDLETDDDDTFTAEMKVLQAVDHPNIVRLFDTFESPGSKAFAMELCPGGNLFDYLGKIESFEEDTVASSVRQICSALAHLHGLDICHCDLKPENILVSGADPNSAQKYPLIKLADFGVAAIKPNRSVAVGASSYAAPEVHDNAPCDEHGDIWSLGMVAFVLLSGMDADTIRISIVQDDIIPEVAAASDAAADCVSWCLTVDPEKRCLALEVLAHDWLTDIAPKDDSPQLGDVMKQLHQFGRLTRIQRAMMQIAAYSMPVEEIASLSSIFTALDTDNDGALTLPELQDALGRTSMKSDQIAEVFKSIDFDRNDVIHYNEFIAACLGRKQSMQREVLWRTFCAVDLDGSGKISRENLRGVLQGGAMCEFFGDKWVEKTFQDMDLDGNGEVDFEEFCKMMQAAQRGASPISSPSYKGK